MYWASIFRWILAAHFWLFLVTSIQAQALPEWAERPDEELFIFGLQLDRYTLSDGFVVFFDGKETYIPLGGITKALEFPISVDPDKGTANGWFLNDDRPFDLDLKAGTVIVENRTIDIDPKNIERHPDDLYVNLSELERWFPFLLESQFSELQISVKPLEPFPLQERITREERRSSLHFDEDEDDLDRIETSSRLFEWPFADVNIEVGGGQQSDERDMQVRQTTTLVGIVAGLDAEATAVADSALKDPNIRVRFGRRSVQGDLLGALRAHEFHFGDVATPDLPLIAQNTVGRGFVVSSFDLHRLEQTNRVTLRGELPVGWEIEVYRNGELIDFQTDQDVGNGRYEFSNLPTVAGLNDFRLVLFGPQGQTRERVEQYFVTASLSKPGESSFRLAYNQDNKDLISFEEDDDIQSTTGEDRLVFQAEYGVSDTFSLTGGIASISVDEERRNYVTAGLQTSLFGALVELDVALDDAGGMAVGGRSQLQLDGWSVFGEQTWYQDFHSEQSDNGSVGGHLRSRSVARLNGHLPDFGWGHQPLSAAITHEVSEMGNWQTTLFGRVSSIIRPFNFALSGNAKLREDQDVESDMRLLVGTLVGDFRLRGEVGFDLTPEAAFSQATLSADWRIDEDFGARVGFLHSSGEEDLSTATAGVYRQFEHFSLGANLQANSKREYSASFGLSFSFGHNSAKNTIEVSSTPFAKKGAVNAQVFLDLDNDGIFDPEDKPIENAGFSGFRLPLNTLTKEDGSAFIAGLETYRDVKIGLNEATLEDPFWVAASPPRTISMRPGTSTTILFPVIETGEVDGLVVLHENSGKATISAQLSDTPSSGKPGSGLKILLINDKNSVVKEVTSAFDGFFFMDRVPYGKYRLALDKQQLSELGYSAGQSRQFAIGADEPFAAGQDLFAVAR